MYTPPNTIISSPGHYRVGLQGFPGTGKTTAAMTFPNIFAVDFDHKLPNGVPSAPFWDPEFVNAIIPPTRQFDKTKGAWPPNRRDAFDKWLRENHTKFTPEQTLLLDSYTMLDAAFHHQMEAEPILNDKMEINTRAGWGFKLTYLSRIFEMIKSCRCNVVMIFHETEGTDANGDVTNKLRPVMQGSFRNQVGGHFTHFFRCHVDPVEVDKDGKKLKGADGKPLIKKGYWWQVKGDETFDATVAPSSKVTSHFMPAHYNSLLEMDSKL